MSRCGAYKKIRVGARAHFLRPGSAVAAPGQCRTGGCGRIWGHDIIPGREIQTHRGKTKQNKRAPPDVICSCSKCTIQGESLWATVPWAHGSGVLRSINGVCVWGEFLRCELPNSPLNVQTLAMGDGRERNSLVGGLGGLGGCNPKINPIPWVSGIMQLLKLPNLQERRGWLVLQQLKIWGQQEPGGD